MKNISIVRHSKGAPGLRTLGLGPGLRPLKGITKLKALFDKEAFWAKNRKEKDIKKMLSNSDVIISCWAKDKLIGFGRAITDSVFRATLWDVIVVTEFQGKGIGKQLVLELLDSKNIKNVEKVYLFTTNCSNFYKSVGFTIDTNKTTLIKFK